MITEDKIELARKSREELLKQHAEYMKELRRMFLEFVRKTPALLHYVETGEEPNDPLVISVIAERWEAIARDYVKAFNQRFMMQWIHIDTLETAPEFCREVAKEGSNNE